jgi:outer membrane receptor protein involved in Fe transport
VPTGGLAYARRAGGKRRDQGVDHDAHRCRNALVFARNALAVAVSTVIAGYTVTAEGQTQEQSAAEAQDQAPEPARPSDEQNEQVAQAEQGTAPTAPPQRDRQGDILEQVIVTARKRSENLQDIPQSVQAITETELTRGDVNGIDDAVRLIPSLSYVSYGPGTTKLIFRGVADSSVSFIADASAALYLDEQPLTQNSQNPDVQMIDIARVEALAGPQGTLYGSSAQSGTLRIITNAPDPTQFEASVGSSVRSGPESEMSYEIDAVLNLPLKEDKVALRLVGFDARDGGFIDNVLGTSGGGTKTNADVADDDFNRVDWSGGRATLLWNINDAWELQTGAVFQYLDANSWQTYDADVGDLEVIRFHDEPHKDDWQQFHVTVQAISGSPTSSPRAPISRAISSTPSIRRPTTSICGPSRSATTRRTTSGRIRRASRSTTRRRAASRRSSACRTRGSGSSG